MERLRARLVCRYIRLLPNVLIDAAPRPGAHAHVQRDRWPRLVVEASRGVHGEPSERVGLLVQREEAVAADELESEERVRVLVDGDQTAVGLLVELFPNIERKVRFDRLWIIALGGSACPLLRAVQPWRRLRHTG